MPVLFGEAVPALQFYVALADELAARRELGCDPAMVLSGFLGVEARLFEFGVLRFGRRRVSEPRGTFGFQVSYLRFQAVIVDSAGVARDRASRR